jgi:hypothetical protein
MNWAQAIMIVALSCAVLPAAGSESRLWRVSDSAGLISAVSQTTLEGGAIILEPGTYEITEPLVFDTKSNVNIEGSGWSTVIRRRGEGDAIVFQGSCWNCRVHGLTISGDPVAKKGSGIAYRGGEWSGICVVDYCHIDQFAESGVRYEGNPKKPMSSNTISNCWLTNNLGDQIYSANNNDFYITGNQLGRGPERTPLTGTRLDHSSAGTYTMNYHWGNTVALRMIGCNFNRIENNRFEQSRETGIIIGDPKGGGVGQLNIITGNTIHTQGESNPGHFNAVQAYDQVDTTFCQNQVFSWNSEGLKHVSDLVLGKGCARWIVKDNIFRHATGEPVVYDTKAGHIVKDNLFDPKPPDPPLKLESKKIFAKSPAKGVAGLGCCWYVRPTGVEMEAVFATQTESDKNDKKWSKRSSDNGKTWGKPEKIEFISKTPEGTCRIGTHPPAIDPKTGRLFRLSNRVCLPTDKISEAASRWTMWYEVSLDGGKTYTAAKQIVGEGFTPDHPFEPIFVGKNGYMLGDQTCVPIFLPDGTILVPIQMAEIERPYNTPFYQSRVLIGKWKDSRTISWEISGPARLSPDQTTRGAFEPTLARVPDGRILMVLRGSNMRKTELPGYRWYSVSTDSGRTWGEVRPWTFTNGEHFFSPSSCSQLIMHSSGRLLWLGNICAENPDGNLPRRPFVIAEVDQTSLLLKKETLLVIDDLQPGENSRMNLSNFHAFEDRVTHEIVFCMPRWFARRADASDWTTDTYLYRIRVGETH